MAIAVIDDLERQLRVKCIVCDFGAI